MRISFGLVNKLIAQDFLRWLKRKFGHSLKMQTDSRGNMMIKRRNRMMKVKKKKQIQKIRIRRRRKINNKCLLEENLRNSLKLILKSKDRKIRIN